MGVEHHRYLDGFPHGGDALRDIGRQIVAGGVHDAHRVRAELHQPGAFMSQPFGTRHMTHQKNGLGLDPLLPEKAHMPFGEVPFGAVGADPHHIHLMGDGPLQVRGRTPSRQHEDGHPAVAQGLPHDRQHLVVTEPGLPDLEGGGTQTVAVPHLDHGNAGGVRRPRIGPQLFTVQLVTDRVMAVAQGRVVDEDRLPGAAGRCCCAHDVSVPVLARPTAAHCSAT